MDVQTAPTSFSAFITDLGIDIVKSDGSKRMRTRVPFDTLEATLGNEPVAIEFGSNDKEFHLSVGELELTMRQQLAGHYFSWANPIAKGKPISLAEARALATKPAAPAKQAKPKAQPAPKMDGDIPF